MTRGRDEPAGEIPEREQDRDEQAGDFPEYDAALPILRELEGLVHLAAMTAGHRSVGGRRPGQTGPRRPRARFAPDADAQRRS